MSGDYRQVYETQELLRTILQFDAVEMAQLERDYPASAQDIREIITELEEECFDYLADAAPEALLELAPDISTARLDSKEVN